MLPPVLGDGAREVVMTMFSSVCHQLPGRSPHVDGVQLAVCHRCAGIYWGLPVAALLYMGFRGAWPSGRQAAAGILGIASLPVLLDWGGDVIGLFSNTPVSRMITGAVFGLGAGYVLTRVSTEPATGSDPASAESTTFHRMN